MSVKNIRLLFFGYGFKIIIFYYYMDKGIQLGTKTLVVLICHYIWDLSGVFRDKCECIIKPALNFGFKCQFASVEKL